MIVFRTGYTVDEGKGELYAVGIVHHVCQLFGGCRSFLDLEPLFGAVDGFSDHRFDIGTIR